MLVGFQVFDAVVAVAGYGLGTEDPQDEGFRAPQPRSGQIFRGFLEDYASLMAKVPVVLAVHAKCDSQASYKDDFRIIETIQRSAWCKAGVLRMAPETVSMAGCV